VSAQVVRCPSIYGVINAQARGEWVKRFYGGQHFPDTRSPEQYRDGEWIALQVSWLRRGYRLLGRSGDGIQLELRKARHGG
jgi:hypothetical protein